MTNVLQNVVFARPRSVAHSDSHRTHSEPAWELGWDSLKNSIGNFKIELGWELYTSVHPSVQRACKKHTLGNPKNYQLQNLFT
jgi:hypothetical protein